MDSSQPPKTKIVCTIGPATKEPEQLLRLIEAGMNICRLNFSHGDHEYHSQTIANIREVQGSSNRVVAIMLDTKGPEIRTGKLKEDKDVELVKGQEFVFTTDMTHEGDTKMVAVAYKNFPKVLIEGDSVLVDDGLLEMTVLRFSDTTVTCRVNNTGMLGSKKGVNLPGVIVDLPALTEKDIADIKFGMDLGIDFIAASFVRKAQDVLAIRELLGDEAANIKIISKIENQEGLDNFDAILRVTDGIMVARGDLGVEIPIEQVSVAQKMMISKCNAAGKFVITATQMLESMVSNPSPTRAEASDVANAVYDGTDCVMLSGETAKGKYPVESVEMMADICREAEASLNWSNVNAGLRNRIKKAGGVLSVPEAVASSAVRTSFDLNARLVVCMTTSGQTARLVSKYRPRAPILAVTSSDQAARHLLAWRGPVPMLVDSMLGQEVLIENCLQVARSMELVKAGDMVVVVCGSREGVIGGTNNLLIITIE